MSASEVPVGGGLLLEFPEPAGVEPRSGPPASLGTPVTRKVLADQTKEAPASATRTRGQERVQGIAGDLRQGDSRHWRPIRTLRGQKPPCQPLPSGDPRLLEPPGPRARSSSLSQAARPPGPLEPWPSQGHSCRAFLLLRAERLALGPVALGCWRCSGCCLCPGRRACQGQRGLRRLSQGGCPRPAACLFLQTPGRGQSNQHLLQTEQSSLTPTGQGASWQPRLSQPPNAV